MGDFIVKFGTIFIKDNSRGSVMELEYTIQHFLAFQQLN